MTSIAEHAAIFVGPTGERWVGRIALSPIVRRSLSPDFELWSCTVVADRVVGPFQLYGASRLQALTGALDFLASQLFRFVAAGGRVLDPNSEQDHPLDTVFGAAWRSPTSD